MLGIWVNVESREFVRVPSYLAVLSNKPVDGIANADTLRRLQVGLDNFLLPQRIGPTSPTPCATIRSARPSCASKARAISISKRRTR